MFPYIIPAIIRNTYQCVRPVDVVLQVPEVLLLLHGRFAFVVQEIQIMYGEYNPDAAIALGQVSGILIRAMPQIKFSGIGHPPFLKGMLCNCVLPFVEGYFAMRWTEKMKL